jgi:hypothetical protein
VNDLVTLSLNLPCFRKQLPTDPPGTYSRKLYTHQSRPMRSVMTGSHAEEPGCLLEA